MSTSPKKADNSPGQKMVDLTSGVIYTEGNPAKNVSLRLLRFNAAGTVTVTDSDGTDHTVDVLAGEYFGPGNFMKYTNVSYSGTVVGWS